MRFETLGLDPGVLKGIKEAGFEQCTPIQEQSLPESLAGKDIIAQSQTGSGKTAVFLLTIFKRVMDAGPNPSGKPKALVMVPTRELASQVIDDSIKLGKHIPIRSVAVYGGVEYDKQIGALKKGVELVVATPGRMIDLYKSRTLSLDNIEIFVIDEADRMFDMGFAPDIMYIAGRLPKKKPRQTMLFSATIDSNVRRLASRYMNPAPVIIEIEPEQVTVVSIDQKVIHVSKEEKLPVLLTLLKRADVERSIIFTNMKVTAEMLGRRLAANGLPAKVLTGDLSQERRHKIIEGMKSGNIKTLVATDVAARGLHIEGITHVFNYDLPDEAANYVHRIGRTARSGKSGKAYSLVCEDHVYNLPEIEKYIERKIESEWIEDAELVKEIVPQPKEMHGRDRAFEGGRRSREAPYRGAQPHSKHGRGRPQPAKKAESAASGKEAIHQRPPGKKRFHEAGGAARPAFSADKRKTERRGPQRHAEHNAAKGREGFTPVAFRPELKPRSAEPPERENVPEKDKEKPGILKRFLKLLKKS